MGSLYEELESVQRLGRHKFIYYLDEKGLRYQWSLYLTIGDIYNSRLTPMMEQLGENFKVVLFSF